MGLFRTVRSTFQKRYANLKILKLYLCAQEDIVNAAFTLSEYNDKEIGKGKGVSGYQPDVLMQSE
jgi:hypothetical protein